MKATEPVIGAIKSSEMRGKELVFSVNILTE